MILIHKIYHRDNFCLVISYYTLSMSCNSWQYLHMDSHHGVYNNTRLQMSFLLHEHSSNLRYLIASIIYNNIYTTMY